MFKYVKNLCYGIQKYTNAFFHELISRILVSVHACPSYEPHAPPPPAPAKLVAPPLVPPQCACHSAIYPGAVTVPGQSSRVAPSPDQDCLPWILPMPSLADTCLWASASPCKMEVTQYQHPWHWGIKCIPLYKCGMTGRQPSLAETQVSGLPGERPLFISKKCNPLLQG